MRNVPLEPIFWAPGTKIQNGRHNLRNLKMVRILVPNSILRNIKMKHFSLKPVFATNYLEDGFLPYTLGQVFWGLAMLASNTFLYCSFFNSMVWSKVSKALLRSINIPTQHSFWFSVFIIRSCSSRIASSVLRSTWNPYCDVCNILCLANISCNRDKIGGGGGTAYKEESCV